MAPKFSDILPVQELQLLLCPPLGFFLSGIFYLEHFRPPSSFAYAAAGVSARCGGKNAETGFSPLRFSSCCSRSLAIFDRIVI